MKKTYVSQKRLKSIQSKKNAARSKDLPVERVRKKRNFPSPAEMAKRLAYTATQIRRCHSLQVVRRNICEKFGVVEGTAKKYIRRVYEEFQSQYQDEDYLDVLAEHAETLREGMREARRQGDMKAFEKIARQYGELVGVLKPASLIKFDQRDQRQQTANFQGVETLEMLKGKSNGQFLNRLTGISEVPNASCPEEVGEPDGRGEAGSTGGEEEV